MTKRSVLAVAMMAAVSAGAAPERTHAFRMPSKMELLRPGEVKPQGWLRDWCVTAKKGYVSRLDEVDKAFPRAWNRDFHPRGKYLDWGDPDRGAWCTEGGAYWFEGLVRLAWELDDPELKAYAKERLEPLLERMNENAIGFVYWMDRRDPKQLEEIERANHGFIVGASGRSTRAMLAYWEATGDERALRALGWCTDDVRAYHFGNPLSLPAAGADTWRYGGDAKTAAALDGFIAAAARDVGTWPALRYGFVRAGTDEIAMTPRPHDRTWDWRRQHGVLMYESIYSFIKMTQWTGDRKYLDTVLTWLDFHAKWTRQPHGVTVADESFGWAGPHRGTETCTVAGDILAYATLASVTGEGRYADHVERSFFNAGPVCTSRDYMHHVYFQRPNRLKANEHFLVGPGSSGGDYRTKHWPLCCTAALTRILPGYVQWMWMKPADGGVAAALYGPNALETELGGVKLTIGTKTAYPFDETVEMTVEPEKALRFPLRLRIPEWCAKPEIAVNGEALAGVPPVQAGFVRLDREWTAGDRVTLRFPMAPKAETMRDYNEGARPYCSVTLGPLLFAYGLPEKDENTAAPGAKTDWTVDSSKVLAAAKVERRPMPAFWDWPLDAPLKLTVSDAAGKPLTLVPYGCARLRISMFPDVSKGIAPLPKEGMRDVTVPSACMGKDIPAAVILPKGYATDPLRRWPVVYLLHGASDSEKHAHEPFFRELADRYGLIVVCPRATQTWWIDSPVDPAFRYETFMVKELVPWTDRTYRTIPDRRHRALTGNSMGGHGSCFLAMRHKDVFGAVGNIFGGVELWPYRDWGKWGLRDRLGDPATCEANWRDLSVLKAAETLKDGELALFTAVGSDDIFIEPNRRLHALLLANRVQHYYLERIGSHEPGFWREMYPQMFRFLAHYFRTGKAALD